MKVKNDHRSKFSTAVQKWIISYILHNIEIAVAFQWSKNSGKAIILFFFCKTVNPMHPAAISPFVYFTSHSLFLFKTWSELRCGGSPHVSCKRDQNKMKDYTDTHVTPTKRLISPNWGPPALCKQTFREEPLDFWSHWDKITIRFCLISRVPCSFFMAGNNDVRDSHPSSPPFLPLSTPYLNPTQTL